MSAVKLSLTVPLQYMQEQTSLDNDQVVGKGRKFGFSMKAETNLFLYLHRPFRLQPVHLLGNPFPSLVGVRHRVPWLLIQVVVTPCRASLLLEVEFFEELLPLLVLRHGGSKSGEIGGNWRADEEELCYASAAGIGLLFPLLVGFELFHSGRGDS